MDIVAAAGELEAQLGRDSTGAAVRRITRNSDAHPIGRLPSAVSHLCPTSHDFARQCRWRRGRIEHPDVRLTADGRWLTAQLISKPRLLPLRIPPCRDENRVPQRTLGPLPVPHPAHLPPPHAAAPRRLRPTA